MNNSIGIGDRVTWYGHKGSVIGYIPANSSEVHGCSQELWCRSISRFDISKTRNETSYVILRDKPKHSNARPQLFRPWGKTIKKTEN